MNTPKWIAGALIGVIAATFALDVEAQRRLGGGKNIGRRLRAKPLPVMARA